MNCPLPNYPYLASILVGEMVAKEFEVLAHDEHHFPQWAIDIKVSVSTRGLFQFRAEPIAGAPTTPDIVIFGTLYMLMNHIHLSYFEDMLAEFHKSSWIL